MDNKCVEKLLETVAFSNGCICSVELIRWEHTHFHPSGDSRPSSSDLDISKKLRKAGELLDIGVLDHIVLGDEEFHSIANILEWESWKDTESKIA